MVDVGPPGGDAAECLERAGVSHLDVLVLSHSHTDHIGGLPQVLQAVKKMFESNEALSKEVETMRREQVAQWADKIIASTPERRGVQLIATQTDRTPEFVKDLAYCLRARAPKLVLVQGSVNDGKPMLTVMLGEEITAQGVNAGAVVREAAKLMQGGGGGQAFFATAGGKNPDGLQAAIDKAVELIMAQLH